MSSSLGISFSGRTEGEGISNEEGFSEPTQTLEVASENTGLSRSRKRARHNTSEKKRADRIRQEIEEMEHMLQRSGKLQKKDRHSILASTVQYIKELEGRLGGNEKIASTTNSVPYHDAFSNHGLPQLILCSNGVIDDCNFMFCWLTNYSQQELRGSSFFRLVPESEHGRLHGIWNELTKLCFSSKVYGCTKSFQLKLCLRRSVLEVFVALSSCGIVSNRLKGFTFTVIPLVYTNRPENSTYIVDKKTNLEYIPEPSSASQSVKEDCALTFAVAQPQNDICVSDKSPLLHYENPEIETHSSPEYENVNTRLSPPHGGIATLQPGFMENDEHVYTAHANDIVATEEGGLHVYSPRNSHSSTEENTKRE